MVNDGCSIRLEEVVDGSSEDLEKLRKVIFGAMFSRDRADRGEHIGYLKWTFDGALRRGYYKQGHIYLAVNNKGRLFTIDAGEVPKEYMDVGQHNFEI